MIIEFRINKAGVYDEVAQTTSYAGKKMAGDEDAYERIFTTDADRSQLERFWEESQAEMCQVLMTVLDSEEMIGGDYCVRLRTSVSFDRALEASMGKSLRSYFVQAIIARWYMLANKSEAEAATRLAVASLTDVKQKAFHKKRPSRPIH